MVQLALALVIVAVVGIGALSWRLSQGPLEMDWLARRLATMADAQTGDSTVSIGGLALAWQGMRVGIDSPLELVLRDITVTDPRGQSLHLPRAAITLSPPPLLLGRIAVRSVVLEGLRIRLVRETDGTVLIDLGSLTEAAEPDIAADPAAEPPRNETGLADILARLAAPPGTSGLLGSLMRLSIHDTAVTLVDRQLGLVWRAPMADLDLNRADGGGASGRIQLAMAANTAGAAPEAAGAADRSRITLDARVALLPGGGVTLAGSLSEFVPARLARLAPRLAPLAAVDVPVTLAGTLTLDAALHLRAATASVGAGAGTLYLGDGKMPIVSAALSAEASQAGATLQLASLRVAARPDAAPTTITAQAKATRVATPAGGQIAATVTVGIDKVAFADLPALWPAGIGGPGTRPWITQNITAGIAQNGHVKLTLTAPDDFSDAELTTIEGGMDAHDVTGWWLRPVPPIEHGEVHMEFVNPDTMDVFITAGRQSGTSLAIRDARVRLTGLAGHDQFIAIDSNLVGPFADVLALLRHPKIKILDRRPLPLKDPAGQITTSLTVSLPLKNDLDLDNVAIHAKGRLTGGHLGGIAAGRDIDRANLDVDVNNDGLRIKGAADIAGLPAQLDVAMDFRAGGPAQVLQRIGVTAKVEASALSRLGLDSQGILSGSVATDVSFTERRDGAGSVAVRLDLRAAGLDLGLLNWRKEAGAAGSADIQLRMDHGAIAAIESVRVDAPRLQLAGRAELAAGNPSLLVVQKLVIGEGTNVTGQVAMPARPGVGYRVTLSGPSADLSGALDRRTPSKPEDSKPETRGTPFSVDAKLDRVLLGGDRQLTAVTAHLENDGLVTTSGRIDARAGTGALSLALTPQPGGRRVTGEAQDAGGLLRALDVMADMRGGHLQLNAQYDDTKPGRPLSGTAEIEDFRIQNAPAIGRLLQAMSLYGLVEVASGPGLGFNRLVAPFSLLNQVLTLTDARAFSASLGMTAKGRLDLRRQVAAIEGTVVPAYFFNTLLGRVPLVGRLFSPEEGGGLFAASYSISGPFADPSVGVNPLSALTPGFLRGLFDIFDDPDPADPKPRPPSKARPDAIGNQR